MPFVRPQNYYKSIKTRKGRAARVTNGTRGAVSIAPRTVWLSRPRPSYHYYAYSTSFRALTNTYSLVVPVKVASPVAMVQVGYILQCMLLCYLHEPRGLWPSVM